MSATLQIEVIEAAAVVAVDQVAAAIAVVASHSRCATRALMGCTARVVLGKEIFVLETMTHGGLWGLGMKSFSSSHRFL